MSAGQPQTGDRVRAWGHPQTGDTVVVGVFKGLHGARRDRPYSVTADGESSWAHYAHVEPERVEAGRTSAVEAALAEMEAWRLRALAVTCRRCAADPGVECANLSDRRNGRPERRTTTMHRQRWEAVPGPDGWICARR